MIRLEGRFLGWGAFFVALGLVPLAVRAGTIPADLRWWELWPLLLIGWGLALVFRRGPAGHLGGIVVAATFGAMLGGLLTTGLEVGRIGLACGRPDGQPFATQSGTFSGPRASVALELSCGELTVTGGQGTGWKLAGNAPPGRTPLVEADRDRLSVRSVDGARFVFGFLDGAERWDLELPTEVVLDLSVTLNAGEASVDPGPASLDTASVTLNAGSATLDLDTASVRLLSATVNAGSLVVRLPASDVTGGLTVNAGSIALCAPPGVGLRLTTSDNPTGSYDYAAAGLSRVGNVWTNVEWATAPTRIELSTTANAGSVSLNRPEACQ